MKGAPTGYQCQNRGPLPASHFHLADMYIKEEPTLLWCIILCQKSAMQLILSSISYCINFPLISTQHTYISLCTVLSYIFLCYHLLIYGPLFCKSSTVCPESIFYNWRWSLTIVTDIFKFHIKFKGYFTPYNATLFPALCPAYQYILISLRSTKKHSPFSFKMKRINYKFDTLYVV